MTGVKKYFTSYSVGSIMGYKKVALLIAGEDKNPTGVKLEIDATDTIDVNWSRQTMQYPSESRKVYMDGTKYMPVKCTIHGTIAASKIPEFEKIMKEDTWLYMSLIKDMGGAYLSMKQDTTGAIKRLGSRLGLIDDSVKNVINDCKLYVVTNMAITENGFFNTVDISLDLTEVVMFEYDIFYKFGVKRAKPKAPRKVGQIGRFEVKKEKISTPIDRRGVNILEKSKPLVKYDPKSGIIFSSSTRIDL